jgi:glycosyltransferase involved in cell wall biosynthesis
MTIGIDISRLGVLARTGTEQYTYELLGALAQRDRQREYVLYCNGRPAALPPVGPNMRLRDIPFPRLWTHARLSLEMAARPPDVLFVPAHVLPPVRPKRSVVTIHDLGYEHVPAAHPFRQRLYLRLSTLWSVRAATSIIAISRATRFDLVERYHVPPSKIHIVYHGVNPRLRPVEDRTTIEDICARYGIRTPYFLYIGTIQPRKNLVRLIEAFAQFLRDRETGGQGDRERQDTANCQLPTANCQLVIAGKRGWLSDGIERRAAELGIADRVRFTGYVDDADVPALLSGALAFVFPSLYEGFGMPVLEAMACGTPVLTSSTSSLPEVAGDAALLVDPTNTAAIADGLMRLATNASLRDELRARGPVHAARFSWERCAEATLRVLL